MNTAEYVSDPALRPSRKITPEERQVIEVLYSRKKARRVLNGFVTTTSPIPMGHEPWGPSPDRIVPSGTTLRIVMVSSMGDCGLSDILDDELGYGVRLDREDAALSDIRLCRQPSKRGRVPEEKAS